MSSLPPFLLRLLRHRLPSFVRLEKHTENMSESTHNMPLFLFGPSAYQTTELPVLWPLDDVTDTSWFSSLLSTLVALSRLLHQPLHIVSVSNNLAGDRRIAKTLHSSTTYICSASTTLPTERCQGHHPVRNPIDERLFPLF
jgi:hypothetical protein